MSPREAEVAGEHLLRAHFACVLTRRAIRTKFAAIDFFACDVMGRRADGSMIWLQVTTAKGTGTVAVKRRKLEAIPWNAFERVLLGVFHTDRTTRPHLLTVRVHELRHQEPERDWSILLEDQPFPRAWLKTVAKEER